MKGTVFALITLICVIGLVIANSVILHLLINETLDAVENIELSDAETATKKFEKCYKIFESREKFISMSVSHKDLSDIDECFSDIIGAGYAGDLAHMQITKNRLTNSLEHLRRLSGINIDSILFVRFHILGIRTLAYN
jgi:hypothetical protein